MLDLYSDLLDRKWTLTDIDEMDIFYYFDILAYRLEKMYKKNKEEAQKVIDML